MRAGLRRRRPSTSLAVMRVLCARLAKSHRARLKVIASHQDNESSSPLAASKSGVSNP